MLKKLLFFLILGILFTACESEYSKVVKAELKSGEIHEDLIFGMKMGQTRKEFFDICWNLNKQKLVAQGPGNQFAKHIMVMDSTIADSDKVEMLFYGIFDKQKVMHGMHMKMSYMKWSPWNETYQSEALMEKLREKYMKEYSGNPFIEIKLDEEKKAYAKVDGNRQILMYPLSNKDVTVKIQDLRKEHSLSM